MSGYAKLFASIVESSIWDEDPATCKVWVTLLALADSEGFIRGSPGWLAKRARVNVDIVDMALTKFQSPDPHSRTPSDEGRRLESTPDGWVIINYAYYRDQDGKELSKDPRRTYQREWMRQKRAEVKASECQHLLTGVNTCQPSASASASVPEGSTEGNGQIPTFGEVKQYADCNGIALETTRRMFDYYQGKNLWLNRHDRLINWKHELVVWQNRNRERVESKKAARKGPNI